VAVICVIILLVCTFLFTNNLQQTPGSANSFMSSIWTDSHTEANSLKYRKHRDDLSRQLNVMKQLYGQQNCEKLELLKSKDEEVDASVSESGGWCANMSSPNSTAHMWDKGFSTALSNFFKGKTVASFGDGPGQYKKHIDSLGQVSSYVAYDGAPFCETVTGGLVKFLDLTAPQYGLPAYDWVVSVEVGEHIPATFEDIYLDNLVRHAKEGIVLSWAVPGQGGLSHVNNKALEAVIAQMEKRGFIIDQKTGAQLRQASELPWLKSNVNVYRREKLDSFSADDV
ncbi:unnamed protein product, partial [Candidula unifasciata]